MRESRPFNEIATACLPQLSPAEVQVIQYFRDNREEVMVASAAILASRIGTSDATVVRAVKALGYAGLDALRQDLAAELRRDLSPASRLARTLGDIGPNSAFSTTIDIHVNALEDLRRDISSELFQSAVDKMAQSLRVAVFGIGPSSAIADYLTIQLGRFGIDSLSLTQTGLLLADDLQRLRRGDLVIILAYSRVYPELEALLGRAATLGVGTILVTDTLGATLRKRVDLVLPVERGRVDGLSMHTATLALFEALLAGLAAKRPAETIASLKLLNDLRARLAGKPMDLPMPEAARSRRGAKSGRGKSGS
jgi:DNA-binding MurR/RpiR family transcriptional regulator